VERGGFEPPKASPTDLQSVPFGRSGTSPTLNHHFFRLSKLLLVKKKNGKSMSYISGQKISKESNLLSLTKIISFVKNFLSEFYQVSFKIEKWIGFHEFKVEKCIV
jgi:hypothetical protein